MKICWWQQLNISAVWIIYPWICLVGEVFIPFKDPPPTLHAGCAPGQSCGDRSLPIRADRAPDQTGWSYKNQGQHCVDFVIEILFLSFRCSLINECFLIVLLLLEKDNPAYMAVAWKCKSFVIPFFSSAGFEPPVSAPKKMDLTKENLNTLLGQGSFNQKTPSTFSRSSAQTSGGRGPGKRGNMEGLSMLRKQRERERDR